MATAQISDNKSIGDTDKLKEPSSRGDIPRSEATLPARGRSIGGQTLRDTSTVELIDLEQQSRSIKRLAELKSEECEIYKLLDRRLRSSLSQRGIRAQPSGVRPGVSTITAQVSAQPPPPRTKSPAPPRPSPPPSPRPRSPRTTRRAKSPARPSPARRGRSRSPGTKRPATPKRTPKQRSPTTTSRTKRSPRTPSPRPRSATRSPARSGTRSPARSGTRAPARRSGTRSPGQRSGTRSPRRGKTPRTARRSPTSKATSRSSPRRKATGRYAKVPKKYASHSMRQLVPVFYATTFWALYCFNAIRMVVPPSA